jgi:tRNA threonylcarbamoyladenosine biosynthesis protein TsaE
VAVEVESSSPGETEALAAVVAGLLVPGDVVAVEGELGTGKTTFVRGACRALGVTGPVASPTYVVGHSYGGCVTISHLDLFRFETVSEADWADLEPYFDGAVVFVEWADRAAGVLPPARATVRLSHLGGDRRRVVLDGDEALEAALAGPRT